jgi:hypothetical protein
MENTITKDLKGKLVGRGAETHRGEVKGSRRRRKKMERGV